jgi:hypothetical protein
MKDLRTYLKESIFDPVQGKLNSDLWNEKNKLKPSARALLLKKLEIWLKGYNNISLKKVFLLGSMTGYQYTENSDIDVNFVINVDEEKSKEMRQFLPNGKVFPSTKHPINYYLATEVKPEWINGKSGPIYDMLKDSWIVEPKSDEVKGIEISNYRAVIEIARFFVAGLDAAITEYGTDVAAYEAYNSYKGDVNTKEDRKSLDELINFKLQEIVSDLDGLKIAKHILWALRTEAFEKGEGLKISTKIEIRDEANYSINNLVYKYVEKLGYFDKIKKILDEKDKWLSKMGIEKEEEPKEKNEA